LGLLGFRFAAMNDCQRALQFGETDFAGLFDIFQLGSPRTQLFPCFRSYIALRDIHAAFQPARLALQRLQRSTVPRILSDQTLFLNGLKSMSRTASENLDASPATSHFAWMYERFLAFGVFSNRMACFNALSYNFAIFSMCLSVCFVLFAIFSSVSSSSRTARSL